MVQLAGLVRFLKPCLHRKNTRNFNKTLLFSIPNPSSMTFTNRKPSPPIPKKKKKKTYPQREKDHTYTPNTCD